MKVNEAKVILNLCAYYGIYEELRYVWKMAEIAELGYDIETKADTVACMLITFIVWLFLWLFSHE